ncbi:MAG: S9 family peptidase [Pseudobacteriovorax sp.]|nr:S9 family peptidase [Pseudobacteriovorax sp.]
MQKESLPFGKWPSEIAATDLANRQMTTAIAARNAHLIAIQTKPLENGRVGLVRLSPQGEVVDLVGKTCNLRTRIQEYGGQGVMVVGDSCYFVNFSDQDIYEVTNIYGTPDQARRITHAAETRFGNLIWDHRRKLILAVSEEFTKETQHPLAKIVSIDPQSGDISTLVSGFDHFNSLAVNSGSNRLVFTAWDFPNMPFFQASAYSVVLDEQEKTRSDCQPVSAWDAEECVCNVMFDAQDRILFVSDRDGLWSLYQSQAGGQAEKISDVDGELGHPPWMLGIDTVWDVGDGHLLAICIKDADEKLIRIERRSGKAEEIAGVQGFASGLVIDDVSHQIYFTSCSHNAPPEIVSLDLKTLDLSTYFKSEELSEFSAASASQAQHLAYPTKDGSIAYANFYEPLNCRYQGPNGEKPPVVVMVHGGPTAHSNRHYKSAVQFWTTRGFAVLDVNYRGSTGYGREYRHKLIGTWGLFDVQDCIYAVKHVVSEGYCDPEKVAIRGGSAGGYLVLATMAFYPDTMKVGANYFGVSDIRLLAEETHKLEAFYPFALVGSENLDDPVYKERSPSFVLDRIDRPLIIFQGADDKVVLPNQSELVVAALKKNGIPCEYHLYEKEGHGFRDAKNILDSMNRELDFYIEHLKL